MIRRVRHLLVVVPVTLLVLAPGSVAALTASFTGPTSALTGETVTFTAADGLCAAPRTCAWTVDGVADGAGPTLSRAFAAAKTYAIGLDVSGPTADDTGHGEASLVVADPPPPNRKPTVSFTSTTSGLTASFAAAANDPEGGSVSISWTFGDGATGTGSRATHTYATGGTYTVTATATDAGGATATDTDAVTVSRPPPPVNQPPTISFTSTASGLDASFAAATGDPEGGPVTVTWSFGDGATGTGTRATHTYPRSGTYTVTATAHDAAGSTAADTDAVTVTSPAPPPPPVNQPPSISFTSTTSGLGASFAAAARDPEGSPVTVSWNFGDGTTGIGTRPTHAYAAGGTYTVTATARDADGATGSDIDTVTVAPPPSPANRAPTVSFTFLTSGLAASFAATANDPEGSPVTLTWDFGDGSKPVTGAQPAHTYAAEGSYTVTVVVRDDKDATGTAKATVTVKSPPPGAQPEAPPTPQAPVDSTTPPAVGTPATTFTTSTSVGTPIPAPPAVTPAMRRMSPFPVVRVAGRFAGRATVLTVVSIRAVGSARVVVRCSGSGCPYVTRTYRRTRLPSGRVRTLEGRRLQPGAILDIRVLQPRRIGKRTVLRFAARQAPRRSDGCVTPAGRAVRCPS